MRNNRRMNLSSKSDVGSTYGVRRRRGFTLIELMVTVAVIAILAAIAFPSYTSYVRKAKRATAQTGLMDLASKEQTYLLDRRTYTTTLTDLSFTTPQEIQNDYTFSFSPNSEGYDAAGSPPSYRAVATPSAALQAKGELILKIDNVGNKIPASTRGYWGN
jgi:type IV pilus assembly protein PilE